MSISDYIILHASSIVDSFLEPYLSSQPGSQLNISNKKDSIRPTSLKVPVSVILNEVKKLRACDYETCFYCREWTQLVFNKDLKALQSEPKVENSNHNKTPDVPPQKFINYIKDSFHKKVVDFSAEFSSQELHFSFINPYNEILTILVKLIQKKVSERTSSTQLSSFYQSLIISFDNIDLIDTKFKRPGPSKNLLDALEKSDKGDFVLYRNKLDLLKTVSHSLQSNIATPNCGHCASSPCPDDIKNSLREASSIYNGFVVGCSQDWDTITQESWGLLHSYLESILNFDQARVETLRESELDIIFQIHSSFTQDIVVPFSDLLSESMEAFKKSQAVNKKTTDDQNTKAQFSTILAGHLRTLENSQEQFITVIKETLEYIVNSSTDFMNIIRRWLNLAKLRLNQYTNFDRLFSSFKKFKDDKGCANYKQILTLLTTNFGIDQLPDKYVIHAFLEEIKRSYNAAYAGIGKLHENISSDLRDFLVELEKKKGENHAFFSEMHSIYLNPTTDAESNKTDKANTKEARKRMKKLDQAFSAFRTWAMEKLNSFFTLHNVVDLIYLGLEPLFLEAQLIHMINFFETFFHKYETSIDRHNLIRHNALEKYYQGINCGRHMLCGVIGKHLLKEAFSHLSIKKAEERHKKIIQVWDGDIDEENVDTSKPSSHPVEGDTKPKKKNKKKKKKNGDDTSAQPSEASPNNKDSALELDSPKEVNHLIKSPELSSNIRPSDTSKLNSQIKSPNLGSSANADSSKRNPNSLSVSDKKLLEKDSKLKASHSKPEFQRTAQSTADKIKSKSSKKILEILCSIEPEIENFELLSKNFLDSSEEGTLSSIFLTPEVDTGTMVKTAHGIVDLKALHKETLINYAGLLSMDKTFMLDVFRSLEEKLGTIAEQYESIMNLVSDQEALIVSQAKEINSYKCDLVHRNSQLMELVQQQTFLRNAMAEFPEITPSLRSILADTSHGQAKLPSKPFEHLDIDSYIPQLLELQDTLSREPPKEDLPHDTDPASNVSRPQTSPVSTKGTKKTKQRK